MSCRHKIVVCIEAGKVQEVQFCECILGVTVEVRAYTKSKLAARQARPAWPIPGGDLQPSRFKRDEHGVYETAYYEPDIEDD